MTPIKLKLTNLMDGQESLLLITKMNSKGVLVQSSKTLPTGSPVRLRIQLPQGRAPLEVEAEVYKVAQKPTGQKGMILRYVNPSRDFLTKISPFVSLYEQSAGESRENQVIGMASQKTMMTAIPSAQKPLQPPPSPKKGKKKDLSIHSTRDEEESQLNRLSFSEETRFIEDNEVDEFTKVLSKEKWKRRVLLYFVLPGTLLMIGWGLFWVIPKMRARIHAKKPEVNIITSEEPTTERTVSGSVGAPSEGNKVKAPKKIEAETKAEKSVAADLQNIVIEDTPGFLKITLEGDLKKPTVSRLMSPRRLLLVFNGPKDFSVPSTLAVNKSPLFRIRVKKKINSLEIVFDLFPIDFPRYDLKEHSDGVTLYLHR